INFILKTRSETMKMHSYTLLIFVSASGTDCEELIQLMKLVGFGHWLGLGFGFRCGPTLNPIDVSPIDVVLAANGKACRSKLGDSLTPGEAVARLKVSRSNLVVLLHAGAHLLCEIVCPGKANVASLGRGAVVHLLVHAILRALEVVVELVVRRLVALPNKGVLDLRSSLIFVVEGGRPVGGSEELGLLRLGAAVLHAVEERLLRLDDGRVVLREALRVGRLATVFLKNGVAGLEAGVHLVDSLLATDR
ncbi:hypothetical protein PFISCL1PPCAC_16457, partial [Pristionchus fissidentatus]